MTADPRPEHAHAARAAAAAVAARLADAGHLAYFAGGCVRDRLRGETPRDYDLATDATPTAIKAIFPRALGVGEAFGVMLVRGGGAMIEVATFRADGDYVDGRRPSSVRFGTAEEDARRRDFTINGIFEHPATGEIVDYVDGCGDLRLGVVRAIGDPAARLNEDRLRALRAVRFAARFGYAIEPATRAAVAAANDLRGVSRERVGHEMRRMLADPGRASAVADLEDLRLDAAVLQGASAVTDLRRLRALPADARFEVALAAWLLDRPEAAPTAPLERLAHWARALMLSNDERELAAAAITIESLLRGDAPAASRRGGRRRGGRPCDHRPWSALPTARRKRLASSLGFAEALMLRTAADARAGEAIAAEVADLARTGLAPTPLVTGDDLVQELAMTPGPGFAPLLEAVYDAQLEGAVTRRNEAVDLARRLAVAAKGGSAEHGGAGTEPGPRRRT